MFERYLSDLVTAHFGHVVENLDAENVRVSAWNGELVLRDLVIRKQALDNVMADQCPVEVAYGKVGHLELRMPWKLIRSQLWRSTSSAASIDSSRYGISMVLTDVNILLTPRQQSSFPEEMEQPEDNNTSLLSVEEKRIRREEKVQDLLAAALLKRVSQTSSGKPNARRNRWQWARDFASRLVSNLSVTVKNIHIRYEDTGSCLGFRWDPDGGRQCYRPGFAVGITLHQFSVQTTEPSKVGFGQGDTARKQENRLLSADNGSFEESKGDDDANEKGAHTVHHKVAAAYRLAIYWDSDSNLISINRLAVDEDTSQFLPDTDEDAEALDYYASSFAALSGSASPDFKHAMLYQSQHFFVLEHISPSLALSLVGSKSATTEPSNKTGAEVEPKTPLNEPPSELNLLLPPCHFSLNRGMLEDVAYLRRSFSLWRHDKRGLFSDSSLRHLTTLRPLKSVMDNPRSWWKYAFAAAKVLNAATQKEKSVADGTKGRRYRGWLGLAKAIRRRKEYTSLYRRLLDAKDDEERQNIHQILLEEEDGLYEEEIVAFRLAAFSVMSATQAKMNDDGIDDSRGNKLKPQKGSSQQSSREDEKQGSQIGSYTQHFLLSVEHRCRIFEEVTSALDQEKIGYAAPEAVDKTNQAASKPILVKTDAIVWRAVMQCPEFSLQVNDWPSRSRPAFRPSERTVWTPIVRLSFAWVQDQLVRYDGSWEIDCVVASLTATDMTGIPSQGSKMFSNLIGRKSGEPGDLIMIDGTKHCRSLSVTIKRKRPPTAMDGSPEKSRNEGSTTWTHLRVAPLEVVYATVPVEALSRVFASVQTSELTDDFQRMKAVVLSWREKQKRRLLQALAHRQKKIFVDVDASAPVFLIPEDVTREDSPLVMVDLGQLRFHNSEVEPLVVMQKYDSKWQLSVSHIQVRCSLATELRQATIGMNSKFSDDSLWQHLVEPFSLDFSIETKTGQSDADSTRIYATAVLPRLVFNLTSSAVRLVLRLKNQWKERKSEIKVKDDAGNRILDASPASNGNSGRTALIVGFEFTLSAPSVAVKLENDVDGRDCLVLHESHSLTVLSRQHSTRIINLSLRGIQGRVLKEITVTGESVIRAEAKLRSLDAVDLYQAAGDDFSLLLSSRSPDLLVTSFPQELRLDWQSVLDRGDPCPASPGADTDLVSFDYCSSSIDGNLNTTVEVIFHELYAEWNPETIAAVQKATRLPESVISYQESGPQQCYATDDNIDSDEEFFDAVEDIADEENSEIESEMNMVSEISTTPNSSFSDAAEGSIAKPNGMQSMSYVLNGLPLRKRISPTIALSPSPNRRAVTGSFNPRSEGSIFELSFKLKKLRVRFNKESRHRRLLTAEMDETAVNFATRKAGGSRTRVIIGNLVFVDSSGGPSSTLYGEILGLQAPSSQATGKPSSLLNMEIEIHRKERGKGVVEVSRLLDARNVVTIDSQNGKVSGSDYYVKAHFSPMRFVFLEQLWFEIVDYFFEGIIGSSVWRARKALPVPDLKVEPMIRPGAPLCGCDAEGVSFTRFDFVLESPVVLLPVTYRSTQFVRLVTDTISITNYYEGSVERKTVPEGEVSQETWLQWFNHCVIEIVHLRMISWNGFELTKGTEAVGARVLVRWPTGPFSRLLAPKWNVDCRFDNLNLKIRPQDCALLQHIVLHNIGEPSRHIDEWLALQNLPGEDLQRYRDQIIVHFGYDKKDVTPSTLKVAVTLPSVKLSLLTENGGDDTVAQAWCTQFTWSFIKLPDRVSRQRITCDIDLLDPHGVGEPVKMIVPAKSENENPYELTYTSVTRPSGDNAKSLQISNACIYFVYPSWMKFLKFFQNLPSPVILTETDVSLSIQVGDHWYRIDGRTPRNDESAKALDGNDDAAAPWKERRESLAKKFDAQPINQFRLRLIRPSIVLPSSGTARDQTSVVLRVDCLDFFNDNDGRLKKVSRFLCLHDLELYTRNTIAVVKESNEYSLIHPWSLIARALYHNDTGSSLNSIQIKSDVLRARAAFSDMTVVLEVLLSMIADINAVEENFPATASADHAVASSKSSAIKTEVSERLQQTSDKDQNFYAFDCSGFELLVIDDSKRHFADAQELIIIRLGKLAVTREDIERDNDVAVDEKTDLSPLNVAESRPRASRNFYTVKARLHSFEVLDCLQSAVSPFRVVATSRSGLLDNTESILSLYESSQWTNDYDERIEPRLLWFQYLSRDDEEWGFGCGAAFDCLSIENDGEAKKNESWHELIELQISVFPKMKSSYELKLRSIAMQWNPSTVIALQRFLGRLVKEAKAEALNTVGKPLDKFAVRKDRPIEEATETDAVPDESTRSFRFSVETVTVCLNKEHQNRRLLQLTLSDCLLAVDDQDGFGVTCAVGNLTAVDTDDYAIRSGGTQILSDNRFVLKMAPPCEPRSESKSLGFLNLRYISHPDSRKRLQSLTSDVPQWVHSKLLASKSGSSFSSIASFDDFLSVSIARLQFSFIRERTEEILDYLSNGLPGKGMGATTRAAQGFLKERIQTQSFLELNVEAPNVIVPRDESASRGLIVRLGDVSIQSWFEEGSLAGTVKSKTAAAAVDEDNKEWWRMLSLSLSGLCGGRWTLGSESHESGFSVCSKPIDLSVILQKPTWRCQTSTLHGSLSFVDLALSYSDYILVQSILRSNIGRRIDRDRWDNVEKSFWMEQQDLDSGIGLDMASSILRPGISAIAGSFKHVTYSSSARFVRYGRKRSGTRKSIDTSTASPDTVLTEFDFKFDLRGLSLKLRRDDLVDVMVSSPDLPATFNYDFILLTVRVVEIAYSANSYGDKSLHLALFTLGLFDLGESGRLARESYFQTLMFERKISSSTSDRRSRLPCAFTVIAEGYSLFGDHSRDLEEGNADPQILVTVDTCAASSIGATGGLSRTSELPPSERVTIARIVINCLTVNALIRPLKEVVAFLSSAWASPDDSSHGTGGHKDSEKMSGTTIAEPRPSQPKSSNFQLKLVAHYPRFFFVADESDIHSRALVLTGLAVVNATLMSHVSLQSNLLAEVPSERSVTTVDAQLHRMESYMNPDVSCALSLKQRHVSVLAPMIDGLHLSMFDDDFEKVGDQSGTLGVALIQPVTVGIEFCRAFRSFFPTTRSLSVNMEPVSTMLSFEDLQLIEVVLRRWSARRNRNPIENPKTDASDDASFRERTKAARNRAQKLAAFGASKPSQIMFEVAFQSNKLGLGLRKDSNGVVVDQVLDSEHSEQIRVGDILVSVNGFNVLSKSLSNVVQLLTNTPRPTNLRFCRRFPDSFSNEAAQVFLNTSDRDIQKQETDVNTAHSPATDLGRRTEELGQFTIVLRRGIRNGLLLERSLAGDVPVVTGIEQTFLRDSILNAESSERIPYIGAAIVRVNDESSLDLGFEGSLSEIDNLCSNLSESETGSDECDRSTYTLTFVELPSVAWGNLDSIDFALTEVVLTFIDDLKGRDMPLFRGKLGPVVVHFEKGRGLATSIVGGSPLRELLESDLGETSNNSSSGHIVKLSATSRAAVEYFHPKIAMWEPLLEPSQLCLLLERRAGYVAIEISDHSQENKRPGTRPSGEVLSQPLCLNLSDASTEVMAQALHEWQDWRRSLAVARPDDDKFLDEDVSLLGKLYLSNGRIPESANLGAEELVPRGSASLSFDSENNEDAEDRGGMKYRIAKKVAAQKAAQAALVFAQKRGAGTHEKGEPAKPFVFRNRTGISIAFARQCPNFGGSKPSSFGKSSAAIASSRRLSVVGEYLGLEDYDSASVTVLADGQEAKFTLDADFDGTDKDDVGADSSTSLNSKTATKVRSYEGRFPRLTVAVQAMSGITIEALTDLPVFKVGTSVRPLRVKKECPETHSTVDFAVPALWEVEIEDNRRILTLASAVQIECLALGTSIEIGVTVQSTEGAVEKRALSSFDATTAVKSIGSARPGVPFYLPIWLSLRLNVVNVYLRPNFGGIAGISWGGQSVLEFSEFYYPGCKGGEGVAAGGWSWKEAFVDDQRIECAIEDPQGRNHFAWLCCHASRRRESFKGKDPQQRHPHNTNVHSILSISVDSSLTIRNLSPMKIQWEVACEQTDREPSILDGSSFRKHLEDESFFPSAASRSEQIYGLPSGDCVEVFACKFNASPIVARFKCDGVSRWSTWASLTYPPGGDTVATETEGMRHSSETKRDDEGSSIFSARQVNVQIRTDFGVPITIGLRNVPKLNKSLHDGTMATSCYGLELIVYVELWFRNLTTLPLNIGCPSCQVVGTVDLGGKDNEELEYEENAAKFSAEAALMEMASVLEFGEKGTGLTGRNGSQIHESFDIRSLPLQESKFLVEEVFEYVEIGNSKVKRRWWASENFDALRPNLTEIDEKGQDWRWIDATWTIDCLNMESARRGGWESCRSLVGEKDNLFSNKREFSPSHNFRRRRWFRRRKSSEARFCCNVQACHQPVLDATSINQMQARQKRLGNSPTDTASRSSDAKTDVCTEDATLRIYVNVGGGTWSTPAVIPLNGSAHGVVRVCASRWPRLTSAGPRKSLFDTTMEFALDDNPAQTNSMFCSPNLSPKLFEICYHVSDLDGDWGEFSRLMLFSPRFFVRNDSTELTMEIKQTGTNDDIALRLAPGEASPFHWADFRLPELVSVRPSIGDGSSIFKWSGGFDICNLGMTAVRVRQHRISKRTDHILLAGYPFASLRSIRATVEIRRGTGGSGINISFQEEDPSGDGSLFRIENLSTFPVWLAQDGVLANPSASHEQQGVLKMPCNDSVVQSNSSVGRTEDQAGADGDLILPGDKMSFALDVPFRQGKYAGRQAATISELLRVRVALAPLSSRSGIETTKVIAFSEVGNRVRLNPSKLASVLDIDLRTFLGRVRVLCVVTTDGPTRVLKLCLMEKEAKDSVFGNPFSGTSVYTPSNTNTLHSYGSLSEGSDNHRIEMLNAAVETATLLKRERLPNEDDAIRNMVFGSKKGKDEPQPELRNGQDIVLSIRAEFSGFVVSLIDSSPSEIAVASMKNVNALARWNALRTSDASAIVSVGWLQVDNHVPNAPFPVAVYPTMVSKSDDTSDHSADESATEIAPLLVIGVTFAPKHKSGMVYLRSVTVAPRDLGVAIDLAFLVRLQRYFGGIQAHLKRQSQHSSESSRVHGTFSLLDNKKNMPLPDVESFVKALEKAVDVGVDSQKFYFGGLSVLPCNIKLSVAPARALTAPQAALEGPETAAIHEAVRKGDVLVGGRTALLGVKVGRKNTTALAVVRGVLKSIVVDALLRLDGASLSFAGFSLRNHITTGSQLRTYLVAHYLASLRSNVPALLGSLAALGNPLGLIRGLGDGVSDFVTEPVKGLKKSVKELDPFFLVDGVARGTESLARHAVGGFADSASLLTETFSKNMAVLTLDRRYAQKRDRGKILRGQQGDPNVTFVEGVESGMTKLVQGFLEGVTGVVKAPLRGAEKKGLEGFAKGVGKGLLGLLVKPMIGISDAATDVMIGVKGSVESGSGFHRGAQPSQVRPRRPMYGRDKVLRVYELDDAVACSLMMRTRLAGEIYLGHVDMLDRVALISVKRLLLLGSNGQEQFLLKFKHVANVEVRPIDQANGTPGWGIIVKLNTPRSNGSEIEVITCRNEEEATSLCAQIQRGANLVANET